MNLPTVSAFGRCGASEGERDDGFSRRVGGRERVSGRPSWRIRWKRLPNESTRVYRPQTDTGERIIGRKVSLAWVASALEARTPNLSPGAAFAALMEGKTILDLAEGLQVRRARVMGVNRIELTGFTHTIRERLRAYGLFGEIISWKLRFFVPVDGTGPAILAKVLECYPIARVADRTAA